MPALPLPDPAPFWEPPRRYGYTYECACEDGWILVGCSTEPDGSPADDYQLCDDPQHVRCQVCGEALGPRGIIVSSFPRPCSLPVREYGWCSDLCWARWIAAYASARSVRGATDAEIDAALVKARTRDLAPDWDEDVSVIDELQGRVEALFAREAK